MPGDTVRYLNRDHILCGVVLTLASVLLTIGRYLDLF